MHDCGRIKENGEPCYESERYDNVQRHIKNVHNKILITCECGLQLKSSSIDRHKKNICPLRQISTSVEKPAESEVDTNKLIELAIVVDDLIESETITSTTELETPATEFSNEIDDISTVQIQSEVKIVKYKDGRVELFQNVVQVGNLSLKFCITNDDNVKQSVAVDDVLLTPCSLADENTNSASHESTHFDYDDTHQVLITDAMLSGPLIVDNELLVEDMFVGREETIDDVHAEFADTA